MGTVRVCLLRKQARRGDREGVKKCDLTGPFLLGL